MYDTMTQTNDEDEEEKVENKQMKNKQAVEHTGSLMKTIGTGTLSGTSKHSQ